MTFQAQGRQTNSRSSRWTTAPASGWFSQRASPARFWSKAPSTDWTRSSSPRVSPSFDGTGPLRRNMTLRASLGLQLGRRSFDQASELDDVFAQRYQAPFSNFALAIEPLIGRMDYDKSIELDNQEMVGIRAGVDFGSFFGLRGFHWWGTDSDFRSTTDLRAYGGEAQFTLASGPGLNPYLVGGAGELTLGEGRGRGARPSRRTKPR